MEMRISFPGGKKVDAELGQQVIRTDQRVAGGGEGSAPEPYALFLASLGTCAGVYVLGFCQSRGLPTEGIELVQTNTFDPETRRLARVAIDIQVPPSFPEKYLDALKRVANRCAVKKALMDPPELEINSTVISEAAA